MKDDQNITPPVLEDSTHCKISRKKILVVDDEKELVRLVSFHLGIAGYDVISANSGISVLEICKKEKPNLVILDLLLPRISGVDVCRRLKNDPFTANIPVIMLTALAELGDKLKGFDAGADDYVTKPFSPRELMVRVKRVLGRCSAPKSQIGTIILGDARICLADLTVKYQDKEIYLTEKEKLILRLLLHNPGRVFTHEEILDNVWGQDNIVEYGNIDVHIRHLREKIENNPEQPKFIRTIKGQGYLLEAE